MQKRCSWKFCKIQRKTPVPEPLFKTCTILPEEKTTIKRIFLLLAKNDVLENNFVLL